MAGFPYHQLDSYLSKLIQAVIALRCASKSKTPTAKSLVKREISGSFRGTLTDDGLLNPREANYIAAVIHASRGGQADANVTS